MLGGPGQACPKGLHFWSPFVEDTFQIMPAVPLLNGRLESLNSGPLQVRIVELEETEERKELSLSDQREKYRIHFFLSVAHLLVQDRLIGGNCRRGILTRQAAVHCLEHLIPYVGSLLVNERIFVLSCVPLDGTQGELRNVLIAFELDDVPPIALVFPSSLSTGKAEVNVREEGGFEGVCFATETVASTAFLVTAAFASATSRWKLNMLKEL
jgi:hypothetical protein